MTLDKIIKHRIGWKKSHIYASEIQRGDFVFWEGEYRKVFASDRGRHDENCRWVSMTYDEHPYATHVPFDNYHVVMVAR